MAHNNKRAGVRISGVDDFDNWNPSEQDVSNLSLMNNASPMPDNYDEMDDVDMFRTEPLHSAEISDDYGDYNANMNLDRLGVLVRPEGLDNVQDGNYQGNDDVFDQLNGIELYNLNDVEQMANDGVYEAEAVDNQQNDAAYYDDQAGDYVYDEQPDGAYQEYDDAYEQSPPMWYDLQENNVNDQQDDGAVYDQQDDGAVYDQQDDGAVYDQQQNGAVYDQQQNGAVYDQQQNGAVYEQQQNDSVYNQRNGPVYGQQQNAVVYSPQSVPVYVPRQNAAVYVPQQNVPIYGMQQNGPGYIPQQNIPIYGKQQNGPVYGEHQNNTMHNQQYVSVDNQQQNGNVHDQQNGDVYDIQGDTAYQEQPYGADYDVQSDYYNYGTESNGDDVAAYQDNGANSTFDVENDAVANSTFNVGNDDEGRLQDVPMCVRQAQDEVDDALAIRSSASEEAFFNRTIQSTGHKPGEKEPIVASTDDAPNVSIQTTPARIRFNFPRRPIAETLDFVSEDEPTEYEANETLPISDAALLPAAPAAASSRKRARKKPPYEGYVGNQVKYSYIPFPKDQFALRQAGKLVKRKSEPVNLARGLRQDVDALDMSAIERGSNIQPYVDENPNTRDLLLSGMFAPYTAVRNTTGARQPLRPRHEYPALSETFRYGPNPRNMHAHRWLETEYAKPPPVPPLPPRETRNVTFDPLLQVPREELVPGTRNDDAERSIIEALSTSTEGLGYESNPYGGVNMPGFLKAFENRIAKNSSNPEDIDQDIFDAYEKKLGLNNQSVDNTNEPSLDSFKLDNGEENNAGDNEEYDDFGDDNTSYDKQSLYGSFDLYKPNESNDAGGEIQSNIPYSKLGNDLNFTSNFDNDLNFSSNFVDDFESNNVHHASDSDDESDSFDLEESILEEIDDVEMALKLSAPSQNILGELPMIASAPTASGPVVEMRRLPGLTSNSAAMMMHFEEHGLPMTASPEMLFRTLFPESQKERDQAAREISSIIQGAARFQKFITPISSSERKGPGEGDQFIDEQTMSLLADDRTMPHAERPPDIPKSIQKTALNNDGTVKTLVEFLVGTPQKPTSRSGLPRKSQNGGIDTSLYWVSHDNETNNLNMGMCPPPSDPSITTTGMDPSTGHVSRNEPLRRNYVQLRGLSEMSSFPGYFVALPNQTTTIQRTEFKTEVLHRAWHALKPAVFDEQDQIVIEITS